MVAEVIRKNVPVYGEYVAQTVANAVGDIPARVEATLEKVRTESAGPASVDARMSQQRAHLFQVMVLL